MCFVDSSQHFLAITPAVFYHTSVNVDIPHVRILRACCTQEEEEPAPKETSIMIRSRNTPALKLRTLAISLDGLLDYDEDDKEEATFELSLFAEGFHEMLMRDYGLIILKALQSER